MELLLIGFELQLSIPGHARMELLLIGFELQLSIP